MVDVPEDVGSLEAPVVGGLTAEVTGGDAMLRVTGEFQATLKLSCHRCANAFVANQDFRVDEVLDIVDEAPQTEEVGETVWAKGHLDVADLVRQNLLLALPSQILCGCAPLDAGDAGALDPRWQKLSGFRPENPTTEE
ncbi:MAG: DUF177 domain-containing protein [Candidatus Sericytochromatia bacterium]|nr:DUF177 domain-containing protein [Candidatus Tanganyikabacteria bacterium]